jgi:3-isopropylmalate/(R)-2-methylmalate dehydratase small subunit
MEPLRQLRGKMAPLRASDVDTDQIIPSDWLKRIERTGFGQGLFSEWREDPGFVLNDERYRGACVLLAYENFGVGSSREHAVWALLDYGFRAVVSPRFGDIFRNNAIKNGLLPVVVDRDFLERLMESAEQNPETVLSIDVASDYIGVPGSGLESTFQLDESTKARFIEGFDDIDLTLAHAAEIDQFESRRRPWLPALVKH